MRSRIVIKTLQDVLNESDSKWKWGAMDRNGECYLYTEKPRLSAKIWLDQSGTFLNYAIAKPDILPTCTWTESLVKRQVKEETKVDKVEELKKQQQELLAKVKEMEKTIEAMEKEGSKSIEEKIKERFQMSSAIWSVLSISNDLLGYTFNDAFKTSKEYVDYLVEKVIEYVIEEYNDGWTLAKDRSNIYGTYYLASAYSESFGVNEVEGGFLSCKPSLVIKDSEIAYKVKAVLLNFNGKNFLKRYFTGEW